MKNEHFIPLHGVGDTNAVVNVYMANKPQYDFMNANKPSPSGIIALEKNEIYLAGQACGNGWRKVFNVFAKFVFALSDPRLGDLTQFVKWQDYRDKVLLQTQSKTALYFSPPDLTTAPIQTNSLHIVMGKTYAKSLLNNKRLGSPDKLIWLNDEFAVNAKQRIIVCPYFDYRQLSNAKIMYLVELIQKWPIE